MMLSTFVKENKKITLDAIKHNLLKISEDKTKIECIQSQETSHLSSLLENEDPDHRRNAQLNFAIALLVDQNPTEPYRQNIVDSLQKNILKAEDKEDHVFDLHYTFHMLLVEKNRVLLKIIFQHLVISKWLITELNVENWNRENIDIICEIFEVAKIKKLEWALYSTLNPEIVKRIQGKIPGVVLITSGHKDQQSQRLAILKVIVGISTIKSVEFSSFYGLNKVFASMMDELQQSGIGNVGLASIGYFTSDSRPGLLDYNVPISMLANLCQYIRMTARVLDLTENSEIWRAHEGTLLQNLTQQSIVAKDINAAIGDSRLEELIFDSCMFTPPLDGASITSLCEALKKCKTLSKITIKSKNSLNHRMDGACFSLFLETIAALPLRRVTILVEAMEVMTSSDLEVIATIVSNPRLEELTIGDEFWDKANWDALFPALSQSSVTKLKISCEENLEIDSEDSANESKEFWIKLCNAIQQSNISELTFLGDINVLLDSMLRIGCDLLLMAIDENPHLTDIYIEHKRLPKIPEFEMVHRALTRNRELANACQALDNFSFEGKDDAESENLVDALSKDAIAVYGARKTNKGGVAQVALSEMLQPAIVRFLQKLLNEKSWQVKRLLRLLPANTDAVKQLYFNYANMLWDKVALMTEAEDIVNLLFKTTEYFFDVSGEPVQFKAEGLFIDYMLIKALGLKQPPEMTPQLRLAFWQYLMLKQFVKSFNMGVPKTEDDIKKINKLWVNIWVLHSEPKTPFSNQQARALRYTKALFELCCMEQKIKHQLSTPCTASAARKAFLLLLSDYLNSYKQIKLISAQHQALLDRLAIRVSGNTMLSIETKEQRLFCFELILLNEWKENNKNELPNTAAFYQLPHKELVKKVMSEVRALIDGGATFIRPLCDYIEALSRQILDDSKELAQRIELARVASNS